MRKLIVLIMVFISMISILTDHCYAIDNSIAWTEDEIRFMEENSIIKLGVDPGFIQFEFIDNDGIYKGVATGSKEAYVGI